MNIHDVPFRYLIPVLLASIVGLPASFAFRRRPWVSLVWLPTVASFSYVTYLLLLRVFAISKLRGEEALAGIEFIYLLPALAICVLGLFISFFARPKREAWHVGTVIPAVLLSVLLFYIPERETGTLLEIDVLDADGHPFPGVTAILKDREGGVPTERYGTRSDDAGRIEHRLQKNQSLEWEFRAPRTMDNPYYPVFGSSSLWIDWMSEQPDHLRIFHRWQPNGLDLQWSCQFVAAKDGLRIPVVLAPHASLTIPSRQAAIREQLLSFQRSTPTTDCYHDVCHNVESVEFIPLLIDTYNLHPEDGSNVSKGLAEIADVLANLESDCRHTELDRANEKDPNYPGWLHRYEQLCSWGHVPPDQQANRRVAYGIVLARIVEHAQNLTKFAFEKLATDDSVFSILRNLGKLAHPAIPQLIDMLLRQPIQSLRELYGWQSLVFSARATFDDLRPLLVSNQPYLVFLAVDTIPGSEMQPAMASEALPLLEAVYPRFTDEDTRMRAERAIQRLRAQPNNNEP